MGTPINHATAERLKQDRGLVWRTPVETHLHVPASGIQQFIAGVSPDWIRWLVNYPWISFAALLLIGLVILLASGKRALGYIVLVLALLLGFFAAFIRAWFGDRDRMVFAQILVCGRVRLDVDPVVTHVTKHFPGDRLSASESATSHALGVNEHGESVAEFFHDRPRHFVL